MLGLVLTAGGARGAYQAGVIERIAELPGLRGGASPFRIVAGASAGAINGAMLAARAERFAAGARAISEVWRGLRVEQVFRSDARALACAGAGFARDFALGGLTGSTVTTGLLDTAPLEALLRQSFPPRGIARALKANVLHAVAISATSYHSGRAFTFVQGRPGHAIWNKSRRVVQPVTLTHRHVLASAAIPIVFPPVAVGSRSGELWFGDGAMRLVAPMSPAIRLGARHVLAIGVRSADAAAALARTEAGARGGAALPPLPCPPMAQICGVFLNAIFLDHLDADLEHLRRMNGLVAAHDREVLAGIDAVDTEGIRTVEPLVISPSDDLALIAQRFVARMPRLLRYVIEGLGTPDAQSADLMSYLLFDAAYTATLVELGRRDADARIAEIEAFLHAAGAFDPLARAPSARAHADRPAHPRRAQLAPVAPLAAAP